jgi:hypothetical protein
MPLKNYCCFLLFLALMPLTAQTDSLGEWQTYHSYRSGTYVTESENAIIYTTGKALFYLDKEDLSISRLAREDGLAEANVRLIKYHRPTETLIIVYESSTIDLLRNGRFRTLREVDNFNFSGDKRIYDISFGDGNIVYFSSGFGLTALDLDGQTFSFTTFTGVRVNSAAELDGILYAATDEGLYRVARAGVNLNDFGNWELMGQSFGLPGDYSSTAVNTYRDSLYFSVNLDVYQLEGDTTELIYDKPADEPDAVLAYLSSGPRFLMAGYQCTDRPCRSREVVFIDEQGVRRKTRDCLFRSRFALEDDISRVWFAEEEEVTGIRYLNNAGNNECNQLEFNGPRTDENYRLFHDGESLWVASSVLTENFGHRTTFTGVYRYRNGEWISYSNKNIDAFKGKDGVEGGDDDLASIVDVSYDPVGDLYWFGSFYEGAIAFDADTESGTFFDEDNSSLQTAIQAGPGRVQVAGTVTDANGFTYLANRTAEEGNFISVRSPDGEWVALAGNCGGLNEALAIEMDENGYLWVIHASNGAGGITVLDVNGTPLDPSDDRCRTILANNSNLPSNNVRSIALDLDGNIWVGTTQGVVLFECPASVFTPNACDGRRPVAIDVDGNGFLLETEEIRSITVDGGNRKWIGTNGGAYLLSPDGEEQLLFFDQGNSPLLDNIVRDIAVDPVSGTVFFGTERGIISFRGDATAASETVFQEALVIFPNPVEPGYTGPISISGLTREARVKITDLSGKLVAEGTSTGGQFLWLGTDYNGRRVTSGVYLVLASSNGRFNANQGNTAVGKIVFIR